MRERRTVQRGDRRPRRASFGLADVPCASIDDIIRVYQGRVRRFVAWAGMGPDTEDAVQDVLADVYEYILKMNRMPDDVGGLVFAIASRVIVDRMRARVRARRRFSDEDPDDAPTSGSSLDLEVDLARIARAALAQLSPEQQKLLRMGVGDDDEHGALTKAAAAMGITPVALRSRIKRARRAFREALESITGEHLGEDAADPLDSRGAPDPPDASKPAYPSEPAPPRRRPKPSSG